MNHLEVASDAAKKMAASSEAADSNSRHTAISSATFRAAGRASFAVQLADRKEPVNGIAVALDLQRRITLTKTNEAESLRGRSQADLKK